MFWVLKVYNNFSTKLVNCCNATKFVTLKMLKLSPKKSLIFELTHFWPFFTPIIRKD